MSNLPAFPSPWHNDTDGNATAPDGQACPPDWTVHMPGMSLRDYFAAKAMQAIVSVLHQGIRPTELNALVHDAYGIADAMLKARESE